MECMCCHCGATFATQKSDVLKKGGGPCSLCGADNGVYPGLAAADLMLVMGQRDNYANQLVNMSRGLPKIYINMPADPPVLANDSSSWMKGWAEGMKQILNEIEELNPGLVPSIELKFGHELVCLPIDRTEEQYRPAGSVEAALTLMDFGLSFALCNKEHSGTRRDVKKVQRTLEELKELIGPSGETDKEKLENAFMKDLLGKLVSQVLEYPRPDSALAVRQIAYQAKGFLDSGSLN